MHRLSIGIVAVSVVALSLPLPSLAQQKPDEKKKKKVVAKKTTPLEGIYHVRGYMNAGGKKQVYIGTAIVIQRNSTYHIEWRVGTDRFMGVGIHDGDRLGATWAMVKDGRLSAGTLLFKVQNGAKGPKLVGKWTGLPGGGLVHQETLTYIEPLGEELKKQLKQQRLQKITTSSENR
ncbi:MAG: hypothetical protein ACFCD0_21525 [Gemmataceae bacterium]